MLELFGGSINYVLERTGSSLNDVILPRMGGSVAKNHHFVCLPLAVVAVQSINVATFWWGSQNVIKCEGRGGVSQKVTNKSNKKQKKKVTMQHSDGVIHK